MTNRNKLLVLGALAAPLLTVLPSAAAVGETLRFVTAVGSYGVPAPESGPFDVEPADQLGVVVGQGSIACEVIGTPAPDEDHQLACTVWLTLHDGVIMLEGTDHTLDSGNEQWHNDDWAVAGGDGAYEAVTGGAVTWEWLPVPPREEGGGEAAYFLTIALEVEEPPTTTETTSTTTAPTTTSTTTAPTTTTTVPSPPSGPSFRDIAGDVHRENILLIAKEGITAGYPDRTFRPGEPVTRGQMATFLARALDLSRNPAGPNFTDIAGDVHEAAIRAVARESVTTGFGDGTYRPGLAVTRDQMASFLTRAFDLPLTRPTLTDVAGVHALAVGAVAQAGITEGFGDGTYRPSLPVTRGQMATFLARALDL